MPNLIERDKVGAHVRIVTKGGGQFVGYFEHLVLFNSPATGSTIALPEKDLTEDTVSRKIAESNKTFGK